MNPNERGNTYYAYNLEALAVFEAIKDWRSYLEGGSKFLVVTYHCDVCSGNRTTR
jgi:hypothetical protein